MQVVKWDGQFATGNPMLDQQHERLFGMINALHAAIMAQCAREEMQAKLVHFARTVAEHFASEERLMTQQGYPQARRHRECHLHLTAKANAIVDDFRSGKLKLSPSLSQFFGDWIRQHIEEEDADLIAWVNARGAEKSRAA